MKNTKQSYTKYASARAQKSPLLRDMLWAFTVGGLICCLGQLLFDAFAALGVDQENQKTLVPVSLIFLSVLTTGFGWFGVLAKRAGAGTLVPITGFANAVASPAMEFKTEGVVLGMSAKMFIIAGPVIVCGTLASIFCGLCYFVVR
jgi:stage V sporulation protein AC